MRYVHPSPPCENGFHFGCPVSFLTAVPTMNQETGDVFIVVIDTVCWCACHGLAVLSEAVN